jgi:hypothetical protein
MKAIYTFVSLLLFSVQLTAQSYRPMLDSINTWTYTSNVIPVSPPQRVSAPCSWGLGFTMQYNANEDTLINGLSYKRLLLTNFGNPNYCQQGYIREDTTARKVYFMDLSQTAERLMYDFTLQTGDSIYVDGGSQFHYFPAGYYVLDSITPFQTISGITNKFTFQPSGGSSPFINPLIWLEGIGFPGELIYDIPAANGGGSGLFSACSNGFNWYAYEKILTCYEHDAKVYFDSCTYAYAVQNTCFNINDSCDYYNICGSIDELSSLINIKVSPNPAGGEIMIETDVIQNDVIELQLISVSGQKFSLSEKIILTRGLQRIPVSLPDVANGLYLLQIEGKKGRTVVPVSIMSSN